MSTPNMFFCLLLLTIFIATTETTGSEQALLSDLEHVCIHPPYNPHFFSTSPVVIYISDFITPSERAHLLSITYFYSSFLHTANF